ncbi:ChaN family lipoprotein [Anaeromyxobacter terrae]|uniref:ChaN family lipoprotein n=1 Tax=Anaeromyxobacter terrae TaxID=2925406 RepID=UPI001F5A308F|nr:ChaN family lipoprotein [Anaeromyxobacter sp. SG22]
MAAIAVLGGVRVALTPRRIPRAEVARDAPALARAGAALQASVLDREGLVGSLAARRILLVGESHFLAEPPARLTELLGELHARDGRPAVLLLELPARVQGALDAYRDGGDGAALAGAWPRGALPYLPIVRWARAHPSAVRAVVASDENEARVALMRALAADTRNGTMAAAIARAAREYPEARVVAYGGMAHTLMAGRYLYDSASRRPVGARLVEAGFSRNEVAAVWLLTGAAPGEGLWPPGAAVSFHGPAGALPLGLVLEVPVAGAERLGEVADFAVHLGAGTRQASN